MAVKLVNVSKKLYVGILRDHSGSMDWLSRPAMEDYNSLIATIKNASDAQDVDTIVFTTRFETENSLDASLRPGFHDGLADSSSYEPVLNFKFKKG